MLYEVITGPAGATEAALAVQLDAREAEALRGRWLVFHSYNFV